MKILLVNKYLHPKGGAETYVFSLGEGLKNQGHEVEYFGMDHEKRCVGNSCNSYLPYIDFQKCNFLEKIKYLFNVIYSFEARRKLRKVLDDFKPDVIHLNNFTYHLTPSIIIETIKWRKENNRNCKIIFTAHDSNLICPNHLLYISRYKKRCKSCFGGKFYHCAKARCIHDSFLKSVIGTIEAYFWNFKNVYDNINSIICCSNFMKEVYDSNPHLSDKTVVLHNFICEKSNLSNNLVKKDYVLYFGRFSEEKGINTLVKVCKTLPNINFVFAGSGPLEDLISSCNNIKNVGFKTGIELIKLIREAKFSILPSEWYENCPFSVIESIDNGTPVVASRIGGIPELIKENFNGELFEPGNVTELREKILNLYCQDALLKEYTKNTYKTKFLSINQYISNLMKYYS